MTIDQKEKFRRILQCLSNGKLEMGRMDLQKALEYFSLAHSRAAEYAEFIKLNEVDKDPPCQKCMNGEPVHTRDGVSGCNEAPTLEDYKRGLHAAREVLTKVLCILHNIRLRNQGGFAVDSVDAKRAIELIERMPGRGLDSTPANVPTPSTGRGFSWALLQLKAGNAVARKVWRDDKTGWVINLYMTNNVIRVRTESRLRAYWEPTQRDMLADDWELL